MENGRADLNDSLILLYNYRTMSSNERVVVLTILKIFNWNEANSSNLFELAFYSAKTSSLILSKQVKTSINQYEVNFNYSLRVAYQSDENEIIIKLSHFQPFKNAMQPIAELTLNLDLLAQKKAQFFPFGKNDKVLKIALGQKDSVAPPNSTMPFRTNERFIRQKEEFLRRIGNTTASSRLNPDNNSSRKSFSQQTKDLLAEIKSMRNRKPDPQADIEEQFHDYCLKPPQDANKNYQPLRTFNKSSSQSHLGIRSVRGYQKGPSDQDSSRQSNRSQKHKLKLKNLQMVPCDNEYYEGEQYKPQRKSDMLASKEFQAKKRNFRSELY